MRTELGTMQQAHCHNFTNNDSDAMTVRKTPSLQYLWVDRVCIDPKNPEEKHNQIRQMGAIYTRAEISIIATAGKDEEFGLPGIGTKPRRSQLTTKVRNIQIVCSMMHPHFAITSSKCQQEDGHIRKLFFPDDLFSLRTKSILSAMQ